MRKKFLGKLRQTFEKCDTCRIATKLKEAMEANISDSALACDEEYILYYGKGVIVYMSNPPYAIGHTIIAPLEHFSSFGAIPGEISFEIGRQLVRFAPIIVQALGITDYNIILSNGEAAGQDNEHIGWEIIPRTDKDGTEGRDKPMDLPKVSREAVYSAIRNHLDAKPYKDIKDARKLENNQG